MQKCITIPLGPGTQDDFKARRNRHIPQWSNMPVADKGKYLGFAIGPGKGTTSWQEPTTKYLQRCQDWSTQGVGMHFHTVAYNTFAISTLGFVAQLEAVPDDTLKAEERGLKLTHKGPNEWTSPEDLWRLKQHFGQSASCRSIRLTAQAAQLRVRTWDPACRNAYYKHDVLAPKQAIACPDNLGNKARWHDWYAKALCINLENNYHYYTTTIGSIEELIQQSPDHVDTDDEDTATISTTHERADNTTRNKQPRKNTSKTHFQRKAYNKLLEHNSPNPISRVRGKYARWDLQDPATHAPPPGTPVKQLTPAWQARRATHLLQLLPKLVPPRVCAAVWGTMWNRWCTHRRWQQRSFPSNRCMLGCAGGAEDAIEHYCHCHMTKLTLKRKLNLDPTHFAHLHSFLLCSNFINTQEELTCIALLIYAIYNATNHYRTHPTPHHHIIQEAIAQWLREGAAKHTNATKVLDNRWSSSRHNTPLPPMLK